jgi:lipopolysaccharide/colanic/teichoic acid biosynthesis glycosyltransferase
MRIKSRKHSVVYRSLEEGSMTQGIYDVPVFIALIKHERHRADRDGNEFALTIFQTEGIGTWKSVEVIKQIKKCIRTVDEIGWLDEKSLGVLLPATSMDGGHRFARRVVGDDIPASRKSLPFRVYSYPRHWISNEPGKRGTYTPNNCEDHEADPQILKDVFKIDVPVWKRALDIFGSLAGIIVLSPLLAAVALYIKLVSPGPVFFRQDRVGYRGRTFSILKFRTMHHNNNQGAHRDHIVQRIAANASLAKLDDFDPRIYRGAKLLRKACVDELPQLFNVLRGEMSMVGPRPCLPYEAEVFKRWHYGRFDVLPGMSGLWQVSGKNKLTFIQMIRLDIAYASAMSLRNDIVILLKTFPAIAKMLDEARRAKKAKAAALPMPDAEQAAVMVGSIFRL